MIGLFRRLLGCIVRLFGKKRVLEEPQKILKVKEENKRTKYKGFCEFCKKEIKGVNNYYCKYCKKWHCEKHRLPEKHGCESPKLPKGMNSGFESWTFVKK